MLGVVLVLGLQILISLAFAAWIAWIAHSKGRSPVPWGLLGFFFSAIGLLIISVISSKDESRMKHTYIPGLVVSILWFFIGAVGLMASIAIPSLLRSRMSANESSALGGLKTIAAAQTDYNNNSYPHTYTDNLACLGSGVGAGGVRFIDPGLASGLKSGYTYTMKAGASVENSVWTWSATCWPAVYRSTGVRSFYIDETGEIRGGDAGGEMGTVEMETID